MAETDAGLTIALAADRIGAEVSPPPSPLAVAPNWRGSAMRSSLPVANASTTSQPKGGWFARLALATSKFSGRPTTFLLAVAVVVIWAVTGPLFGFSDTWQLVINTGTTIVTFLMVFLIQATQNRDTLALQLKLDELILATKDARNQIAGIEEAPDHEIERAKVEVLKQRPEPDGPGSRRMSRRGQAPNR
jgi:low affinity Fe/Cu permease